MNEQKRSLKEQWQGQSPQTRRLLVLLAGLLLGIMLLTWSGSGAGQRQSAAAQLEEAAEEPTSLPSEQSRVQLEQELAAILSGVRGAGRVQVAVWYSAGSEAVYAEERETQTVQSGEGEQEQRESTTLAEVGDQPWLLREESPQIQGVAVVAEGAGDPAVKERLLVAVKGLLGVRSGQVAIVEGERSGQ